MQLTPTSRAVQTLPSGRRRRATAATLAPLALLGLVLAASPGCTDAAPGSATGDIGGDAWVEPDANTDTVADTDTAADTDTVADAATDAATDTGAPADTVSGTDAAADTVTYTDTAADAATDTAADTAADAATDTAADTSCSLTLTHTPVTTAPFGPVVITAQAGDGDEAASPSLVLHYRTAVESAPWQVLSMTEGPAGTFSATIPAAGQGPAGLDYRVEAQTAGCAASSPQEPADAAHHVKLWGEFPVAVGPTYYYHPSVWGLEATYSREEAGGLQDDVVALDLGVLGAAGSADVTSLPKPQGQSDIWGRNIVWVDGRFQGDDSDPNLEIYLWDRETQTEHRVTDAPLGQYGVTVHGRIIGWRDDRHMTAPGSGVDGDIYLYDMGPDAIFGTADDVGELRLTPNSADQTAPDVWTDPDTGRVRVVWYDFRDDTDGICDAQCDWNVYLYDFGDDGVFGTADDLGPTQITSDPLEQTSPVIDGQRIVWLDARGGNYLDPDIYMYDLGPDGVYGTADDGGESLIDVPTKEPDNLDLDGDRLVFEDFRAGSWEIFVYDLATQTETQLTDIPGGQFYPRIHRDIVVWQDTRNNGTYGDLLDDVYGYVLP